MSSPADPAVPVAESANAASAAAVLPALSPEMRNRILAITSGKGGVGKTMVCANLAAALSRRGERVLVLDADLGLANLDVVLNLMPKVTLHDVFTGKSSLEDAVLAAPGGFSVLLAGSGMVEYSRLTPEVRDQLQNVIQTLTPKYDYVLLDTGAGISDVVLYTVSLAGQVVVVATPEPTSLTDAYATIKILAQQQQHRSIRLVVNQVMRSGDGRSVANQLQLVIDRFVSGGLDHPLKLDYLGDIPVDPTVREAVLKRHLLLESFPGSPAAAAIVALATRLDR